MVEAFTTLSWRQRLAVLAFASSCLMVLAGWWVWFEPFRSDTTNDGTRLWASHFVGSMVSAGGLFALVFSFVPPIIWWIKPVRVSGRLLLAGVIVWGGLALGSTLIAKTVYASLPKIPEPRLEGNAVRLSPGEFALERYGRIVRRLTREEYRGLISLERTVFTTIAVGGCLASMLVAGIRLYEMNERRGDG
jgi:hypothetical protein